jgi:hypothetical protein
MITFFHIIFQNHIECNAVTCPSEKPFLNKEASTNQALIARSFCSNVSSLIIPDCDITQEALCDIALLNNARTQ